MSIRDSLIKTVKNMGGNTKNIVTINDGVREMAAATGASGDIIKRSTDINTSIQAISSISGGESSVSVPTLLSARFPIEVGYISMLYNNYGGTDSFEIYNYDIVKGDSLLMVNKSIEMKKPDLYKGNEIDFFVIPVYFIYNIPAVSPSGVTNRKALIINESIYGPLCESDFNTIQIIKESVSFKDVAKYFYDSFSKVDIDGIALMTHKSGTITDMNEAYKVFSVLSCGVIDPDTDPINIIYNELCVFNDGGAIINPVTSMDIDRSVTIEDLDPYSDEGGNDPML